LSYAGVEVESWNVTRLVPVFKSARCKRETENVASRARKEWSNVKKIKAKKLKRMKVESEK
jgi:hypothetical protein